LYEGGYPLWNEEGSRRKTAILGSKTNSFISNVLEIKGRPESKKDLKNGQNQWYNWF